ncbi:DUF4180 domain-containing protein [Streptomyces somaliensis]|uniref:DUF4180 domain-containing protein n=1 Tax=Streptomyces somaliensis TaxID=78355 RepID=UPI0020CDADBB|nr:DUF4180 domain-containing protein [Streptomyces somaliensis]MCP9944112.1 DUF4180 domain-containing protein [Streptomyces somaliensis]MCP9962654.1 DUF4180 domain-containing protein [Streptomyces somaliensis]MCP9975486.1 DUF4180 domain-containing protein [Streptomyces somaliensis]
MTTPPAALRTIHGVPVWMCPAEGAPVAGERDALDLIGDAGYWGARWVVVPVARLDEAFFRLRTRVAGDVVQKFVNYRLGLVVVGDVSARTAGSPALRDFVRECNRGTQTWFLPTLRDLADRLAP